MAHWGSSTPPPEIRSPERDLSEEAWIEEIMMMFDDDDPFYRFLPWRQAALELDAARCVTYTPDIKWEEEEEMIRRKIQPYEQMIWGAFPLKEVWEKDLEALMLVPGTGPVGLFGPAPPEVATRPPFEPTFGRRAKKAGKGGGLPMGRPEPRKIRRGRAYRRRGF